MDYSETVKNTEGDVLGRERWPKDLLELLANYDETKNDKDLKKILDWLGKPWMHFNMLYGVYSELLDSEALRIPGEYKELRVQIARFMLKGVIHNRYDRYQLCSFYAIAVNEGLEDEALKLIDNWAATGHDGYDAKTWLLFWACYPKTKLAEMAERKRAELGKPFEPMSEEEKALTTLQMIMGSVAG